MGHIFIPFAELWVTFFQTCAELWVKILNKNDTSPSKTRIGYPPPPRGSDILKAQLTGSDNSFTGVSILAMRNFIFNVRNSKYSQSYKDDIVPWKIYKDCHQSMDVLLRPV